MGWREKLEELKQSGYSVMLIKYNLDRQEATHDLSTGALNYTTSIAEKFKLHQILMHSDSNLSDTTITAYFNSVTGANYDTAIGAAEFEGETDLGFIAGDNLLGVIGEAGDEITVKSTGSDNSGNLYITLLYEVLT